MFDYLRRALGFINVEEKNDVITITGFNAPLATRDILKVWKTSKVAGYLFREVTQSKISFNSFFAIEVEYIFKQLLDHEKTWTDRRGIGKILELLRKNTWMRNLDAQYEDIIDLSQLRQVKKSPLPEQRNWLNYYNTAVPRYGLRGALLSAAPGAGKAQKLDAPVRIPGGWKRMGDMQRGDIVVTPDGGTANVIGVYPQGIKSIFEITFADGRKTEACGEHLWKIYNRNNGRVTKEEIVTTLQISKLLEPKDSRIYVPLVKPEAMADKELPVDPYLLGILIGDGCLSVANRVNFSTPDQHVVDEVSRLIPDDTKVKHIDRYDYTIIRKDIKAGNSNQMNQLIKEIGLAETHSHTKHIPEEYMETSFNQKLRLIQGLMDSDGYIDPHSSASYCTTSKKLAIQVQYLIRSIGGHARISEKDPVFTYKGERKNGRKAYNVNIRYHKPSELFTLPKKKERANDSGQYCDSLKLGVKSVKYTGKHACQCIMLDSAEHLYITNDFIVTHNTLCSIMTMLCRKKDYVIVIAPKKATRDVWERTITTELTTEQDVWVAEYGQPYRKGTKWIVAHYERLDEVVKLVKEHRLPNVGIILDESHNLNQKTKESTRTGLFVELCQVSGAQDIVWASGTALTAMGTEAVPLFRTLIPGFTNDVELAMRKVWGRAATKANDILANRLGIVSFSVPKSKFMSTKPIETTVKVKIKNGAHYTLENIQRIMMGFIQERFKFYTDNKSTYQKIYDEALAWYGRTLHSPKEKEDFKTYNQYVHTFVTQGFDPQTMSHMSQYCNDYELKRIIPVIPDHMRKPFKDARSVIKYVDLKIKGECLGRVLGKERTMCHVELAEAIPFGTYIDNAKKKTLIFTDFVPALETMAGICRQLGYKPVVVYGDTNKDLVEMVRSFRASEDVNPGIATFRSLAEAVPLTEANQGLMLNKPFRFHHYEQAVSRMHRIGQEDDVYIFNFVLDTGAQPNISTRSEDIMAWSKTQVDALMGLDRYGSTIEDVTEIAEAVGLESFEEKDHAHQFLSAGMESWLMDLESQELVVEDYPTSVSVPRQNKAFDW